METLDSLQPSLRHLTDGSMSKVPNKQCEALQDLAKAHIDSFNAVMEDGEVTYLGEGLVEEFTLPFNDTLKVSLYFKSITVSKPSAYCGLKNDRAGKKKPLFPKECRMSRTSYLGEVLAVIGWKVNGNLQNAILRTIGRVPIMVKSERCHLNNLSPRQLVDKGEEIEEFGGYFIVNGNEKIIRMVIQQRRNMPLALIRPGWAKLKPHYTEFGVSMRCVKKSDQSISGITLHYLSTGDADLTIRFDKTQFFIPIMMLLIALSDESHDDIIKLLACGGEEYIKIYAKNMIRNLHKKFGVTSKEEALNFLGELFKVKFPGNSNIAVAKILFSNVICTHVESDIDKFHVLVEMTRKLFKYANHECSTESTDWVSFQEVLTAGHLYRLVFRESLKKWMKTLKLVMLRSLTKATSIDSVEDCLTKSVGRVDLTKYMTSWISTGSVENFSSDLGLTQTKGLTILADKLNYLRYCSHFRSVHRGAYFQNTKTTEVRKLRPESWGFLCPTHTPDGGPCGLLLHLTAMCQIVTRNCETVDIERQLYSCNVIRASDVPPGSYSMYYVVHLDGKIVGRIHDDLVQGLVSILRERKLKGMLPKEIEICLIPKRIIGSQYPALYIFTNAGRFIRPVKNRIHDSIEMIGSMEQTYLQIASIQQDIDEDDTIEYIEVSQLAILSELAAMIPFSDHNHACRNMYQCQMAKQTMGVPLHSWRYRTDNKLYSLTYPQAPLIRTPMYDYLKGDDYPIGTNAVVAVMSYTGFDMEDAIAINKDSYNRGFGHGCIVKTMVVDLREICETRSKKPTLVFENGSTLDKVNENIDRDGMPYPGVILEEGDPMYSYYDLERNTYKVENYKGLERAYIQQVSTAYSAEDREDWPCQKIIITLRIPRKPHIGDKFSSRHGQKGVCSILYPSEDLPFTLDGTTPDIIFNPHGFPSRMTVGMIIEIMAGKVAAQLGECQNACPFVYTEGDDEKMDNKTAVETCMDLLQKAGFNYGGHEVMLCGETGMPVSTYIFRGVVYYQRLRHMVLDKWQVRMYGLLDMRTLQPVGGRKRGGGLRFGEMERDALIAHGASAILQDRLFNCSDGMIMRACVKCGSIISPTYGRPPAHLVDQSPHWWCLVCESDETIVSVSAPYIFRYLVSQMAALNMKTKLTIEPV